MLTLTLNKLPHICSLVSPTSFLSLLRQYQSIKRIWRERNRVSFLFLFRKPEMINNYKDHCRQPFKYNILVLPFPELKAPTQWEVNVSANCVCILCLTHRLWMVSWWFSLPVGPSSTALTPSPITWASTRWSLFLCLWLLSSPIIVSKPTRK